MARCAGSTSGVGPGHEGQPHDGAVAGPAHCGRCRGLDRRDHPGRPRRGLRPLVRVLALGRRDLCGERLPVGQRGAQRDLRGGRRWCPGGCGSPARCRGARSRRSGERRRHGVRPADLGAARPAPARCARPGRCPSDRSDAPRHRLRGGDPARRGVPRRLRRAAPALRNRDRPGRRPPGPPSVRRRGAGPARLEHGCHRDLSELPRDGAPASR